MTTCMECWGDSFPFEDHFFVDPTVQPLDDVKDDWCNDFELLVKELHLVGYDNSTYTECSQFCSLPVVFCDGPKMGPFQFDFITYSMATLTGARSEWYQRKYAIHWEASETYTGVVPLPESFAQLKAVNVMWVKPTGGPWPEELENTGAGGLRWIVISGNGTHGLEGTIPAGFWNVPVRRLVISDMPNLVGPLPTYEQAGVCGSLDDEFAIFGMNSLRGSLDFLTRCTELKWLYVRTTSPDVTGNLWDILYASPRLAQASLLELSAGGADTPGRDWEAWCMAEKSWGSTRQQTQGEMVVELGYQLSGTLPAGLKACERMATGFAFLGSLSGIFPFSLKGFTLIKDDYLQFGGSAPGFSGPLPEMPAQFKVVDWSGNQFTGPIPLQWSELVNVSRIDVSRNQITVPPLQWGHITLDKTVPRDNEVAYALAPGVFIDPPVWDKFTALSVAHNPIGWHQSFFFSTVARYPSLRSVDATNTSMFGMPGDLYDLAIWDETMMPVNSGGGHMSSLEVLQLGENDLLGFGVFSLGPQCRAVLCEVAVTISAAYFHGLFFPALRVVELQNNARLTFVSPSLLALQQVNLRGTAVSMPVAPTRDACQLYMQQVVAVNHESVPETMQVCLYQQQDFFSHPTDPNSVCATVTSMDPATSASNQLLMDPATFNPVVLCKCTPGHEYSSATGARACQVCPEDSYRGDDGGHECVACPAHSSTAGRVGQTSQAGCVCDPGYVKSGSVCEPCPMNTWSDEVGLTSFSSCQDCPADKVTLGTGTSQQSGCLCPVGTYTDQETSSCRSCLKGFYCPTVGAVAGTPCPATLTTLGTGAKTELRCVCEGQTVSTAGKVAPGMYDAGFLEALQAQANSSTDDAFALAVRGATGECRPCPGGMLCYGGLELMRRLHTYPVQYYPDLGAESVDTLGKEVWSACRENAELLSGDVVNQQCLRFFCGAEHRATDPRCKPTFPELQLGFWSDPDSPFNVYKCQAWIDATLEDGFFSCPGGRPGTCTGERTGLACGRCKDGMYMAVDGSCLACEGGPESLLGVAVAVLLVVVPGIYYFINGKITAQTSTMMATGIAMGSLLTLTQHFSVLGQLTITWDEPMKSIWAFLGLFMFDPKILASACAVADTSAFVGRVILPAFLILWMTLVGLATQVAGKVGVLSQELVMVWPKIRNTLGQVFQAFYIATAMSSILAFQCFSSPNGTSALAQHPYILCGSGDHTLFVVFGIVGIACYVVGYGVFYIWACIVIPGQSQNGLGAIQAYRFIFFRFRPEFWYWGSVFLFRNLLLALASIWDPANPYTGVIYLGLVAVAFLIAQCVCWPWRTTLFNVLDTAILACMVTILFSTVPFIEVSDVAAVENTKQNLLILMVVVFVGATSMVVGAIVMNIVQKVLELRDPQRFEVKQKQSDAELFEAWSQLMHCAGMEKERQFNFTRGLGTFDRRMVHKLLGIAGMELSGSAILSKKGSRRVAMQRPQRSAPADDGTGAGAQTSAGISVERASDGQTRTETPPETLSPAQVSQEAWQAPGVTAEL